MDYGTNAYVVDLIDAVAGCVQPNRAIIVP
jgi:hypothetical protein